MEVTNVEKTKQNWEFLRKTQRVENNKKILLTFFQYDTSDVFEVTDKIILALKKLKRRKKFSQPFNTFNSKYLNKKDDPWTYITINYI